MTVEVIITGRLVKAKGVVSKKVKNQINNIVIGTEENHNEESIDVFMNDSDAIYALEFMSEEVQNEVDFVIEDLIATNVIDTGKVVVEPKDPVVKDRKMSVTITYSFRQRNCFNTTTLSYVIEWEIRDV